MFCLEFWFQLSWELQLQPHRLISMFTKLYDAVGVIVGEESVRVFMTGLIGSMHLSNIDKSKREGYFKSLGNWQADNLRGSNSRIDKLVVACCSRKFINILRETHLRWNHVTNWVNIQENRAFQRNILIYIKQHTRDAILLKLRNTPVSKQRNSQGKLRLRTRRRITSDLYEKICSSSLRLIPWCSPKRVYLFCLFAMFLFFLVLTPWAQIHIENQE